MVRRLKSNRLRWKIKLSGISLRQALFQALEHGASPAALARLTSLLHQHVGRRWSTCIYYLETKLAFKQASVDGLDGAHTAFHDFTIDVSLQALLEASLAFDVALNGGKRLKPLGDMLALLRPDLLN